VWLYEVWLYRGLTVYRLIKILFKVLISIWKNTFSQIIYQENIINLKIRDDSWNIGCKQNHIMITFYLLNKKKEVLNLITNISNYYLFL